MSIMATHQARDGPGQGRTGGADGPGFQSKVGNPLPTRPTALSAYETFGETAEILTGALSPLEPS